MTQPGDNQRLHALLCDNAARLTPSLDLQDRILASAPGHARRLEAVLRKPRALSISTSLSDRILAAAPADGFGGFLTSLWPFGPVWRPAVVLAALAVLGAFLGSTDAATMRGEVSVNGALSEEVYVLALSINDQSGPEDLGWAE